MKISFVIPAYNEEHYIGLCLDAILREAHDRNDIEIIVVDNNSTDGTGAVVAKYPGVRLVHESRRGANRARETGFEAAHGEFIAFIDADTMMPEGWISKMESEFAKDKRLACISGPFIYYDLPLGVRLLTRLFYVLGYIIYLIGRAFFRTTTIIQGGNYMVRATALKQIGGQNVEILFYGDDTDLALRLSRVGNVKFSFKIPTLASGRRLAKEGAWMMGFRYALNNFWMVFFRRPFTMAAKEVRFGKEGLVYRPERKGRERLIASIFTGIVLIFFGLLVFVAYRLAQDGVVTGIRDGASELSHRTQIMIQEWNNH